MIEHDYISDKALRTAIRNGSIIFGGNRKLKIYGALNCASGKRMKQKNRVFFATEADAIQHGYRPCGHCMREAYKKFVENGSIQSNAGQG